MHYSGANNNSFVIKKYTKELNFYDYGQPPISSNSVCNNAYVNTFKVLKDSTIFAHVSFGPCNTSISYVLNTSDSILLYREADSLFFDIEAVTDTSWALIQELPEPRIITLTHSGDTIWNIPMASVFGDSLSGPKKLFVLNSSIVVIKQLPQSLNVVLLDLNGTIQTTITIPRQYFGLSNVYHDNNHLFIKTNEKVWIYRADLSLKFTLAQNIIGYDYTFSNVKIDDFNNLYLSSVKANFDEYNELFYTSQFAVLDSTLKTNLKRYYQIPTHFSAKILAIQADGYLFSCVKANGWSRTFGLMKTNLEGFCKDTMWNYPLIVFDGVHTATDELESQYQFNLYPNPAKDQLTVETDLAINAITVQNLTGQCVYSVSIIGPKHYSFSTPFQAGVYVVFVETSAGVASRKLIISNE